MANIGNVIAGYGNVQFGGRKHALTYDSAARMLINAGFVAGKSGPGGTTYTLYKPDTRVVEASITIPKGKPTAQMPHKLAFDIRAAIPKDKK